MNIFIKYCYHLGILLVLFTSITFSTASILLSLHIPISGYIIILSIIFSLFIQYSYSRKKYNLSIPKLLGFYLLCITVSILIAIYFYDITYDGQAYHMEAVIQLSQGWNPFYEILSKNIKHSIWINHYPKASWINAAVLYKFIGLIESGKTFNIILILANFFLTVAALWNIHKFSVFLLLPLSAFVAFDPINFNECLSFYVDGQIASLLNILLACLIIFFQKKETLMLWTMGSAIILLVNLKFTPIGYVPFYILGFLIIAFIKKKRYFIKPVLTVSIICGLIGILYMGFNPYITNTFKHKHPFHPLAGNKKIDFLKNFTSTTLLEKNRIERLILANLSITGSIGTYGRKPLKFKIPFSIMKNEYKSYRYTDRMIAGFGVWFSGIMLISIALGFYMIFIYRKKISMLFVPLVIYLLILLSIIINPACWYTRYVPQLWILPIVILVSSIILLKNNIFTYISILAITVNLYLLMQSYFYHNYSSSEGIRKQLEAISILEKRIEVNFGPFYSNRKRLSEVGISYVRRRKKDLCPTTDNLFRSKAKFCIIDE